MPFPSLISVDWLSGHLADPGVVVVDATFELPGASPTAQEKYAARHIPGAVFFDVDGVADKANPLPHMLPDAQEFARTAGALGIGNDTTIIVYDRPGLMSAGRVWWTFRTFGHDRVAVLDGGLTAWLAAGNPVSADVPDVTPAAFEAHFDPSAVVSKEEMLANVASGARQILDARSKGRFTAAEKEPRPGLRSGHMPGSLNLPFNALTDATTGRLKTKDEIRGLMTEAGVDLSRPVICTCGSGVTAGALAFALHQIGKDDVAIYDGSWAEWGMPGDTPVIGQ